MPMGRECESRGPPYKPGQVVPPGIEAASDSWRLLPQIDPDGRLKMNWRAGGTLYVFVRETDARAGDSHKEAVTTPWTQSSATAASMRH